MKRGVMIASLLFIILLLSMSLVSSELFLPSSQREITVNQNVNYYYIKSTNKLTNNNNYFGLSKTDKGHIGIGLSNEYIGNMFLVPAFQHPVNHNWYLCPLIDTGSYSVNLGSDYIDISGSGTYTCYRYDNPSLTGSVDMTINQIKFQADSLYGNIKITVDLTVDSITPEDTGFAYIFVPKNQNKFRYAKINGNFVDLTGTEQSYSVDKDIQFYDDTYQPLNHMFDWSDMPSGTNYISKVVTLGTKKGLLLGSYGYGSSQNIYVDPIYYVDYSPEPAEHLIYGAPDQGDDSIFSYNIGITEGVSDDNDSTNYDTYIEDVSDFGNITGTIDSVEFDTSDGSTPDIISITENIFVVAYQGSGLDGYVTTFNIQTNGSITQLDSFEFDGGNGETPKIERVSTDVYVVAYDGPSGDGHIQTINISTNGSIIGNIDNFEYDNLDGMAPDIISIDSNIWAVAYSGVASDGFVETIGILNNGTITGTIDTYEFDTTLATTPTLEHIDGDIYGISYVTGTNDLTLITLSIMNNGSIGSVIETKTLDTGATSGPKLLNLYGNNYVTVYAGSGLDGYLVTTEILNNGSITVLDIFEYDTNNGPTNDMVKIDSNTVLVANEGAQVDGFIRTIDIEYNGTITGIIDEYEFDISDAVDPDIIILSPEIYVVAYTGPTGDGYIKTIGVATEKYADNGTAIVVKFNETYDSDYIYWLRLKKTTLGTEEVKIYAYQNDSAINTTNFVTKILAGIGWFSINVSSIMEYEIDFLNYSRFRFFTDFETPHNFSEVRLRKEINDTIPPSITVTDCIINDTYLTDNEVVRLMCNVTDNIGVDAVNGTINTTTYMFSQLNGQWYYDFTCTETNSYNWNFAEAWDLVGNYNFTNPNLNFTCLVDFVNITLVDYYALNSTDGRIDNFTTDNLIPIEYLVLNYAITAKTPLQGWYFNFTADGFNPCSLGNKQSSICYNYDNDTYRFIQFIEDVNTNTYDGTQGNLGDRIVVTKSISGDNLSMNISLKIDEHYNPNVFKWYDARYNFSDVKWQAEHNVSDGNLIKVEIDQNIIPLDADQYKLDFRVQQNYPVNALEAYACNSSYMTGHPHDVDECVLVAEKDWYELQDVGTKFRAIFTKNLIDELGDIKYIILEKLNEGNASKYYAIKTYKVTASNYTTHWEYSTGGDIWNNSGDGYETELNINWFYDGAEPTGISTRLYSNSMLLDNYLEYNIIWDIDAINNYPPIIHILTPYDTEIIQVPYNITFQIYEPNDDDVSGNLSLYYTNGTLYTILATGLNQLNESYTLDENTGTYDLELKVCEINTSDLYCSFDILRISIFFPITNLSVFSSKNPVEILEEYIMYANYTDFFGQPISNATCYGFNSSVVGGGQANWGRGVLGIGGLPTVENAIHTEVPGIYGNNTVMVQIQDVPLGKSGYGFNFRFHTHTEHPEDGLRVYANCNNSLSFGEFTLIDTVLESEAIVTNNETTLWGFRNKVIFGFPMPTSNCSIMFESYGTSETNNWMIADTNTTLNLNNAYYSDDFGENYILRNNSDTRSPFVDMAIGLSIPDETTMAYNSTTGLYSLENIRHGRPFTFHDQVICMADGYDNATDYVDMILQDNVPPITQIVSINPDPAELLSDNVTIHWTVNDAELLASFISIRYPNVSLLIQSEDEPLIINSTYLSVTGNYSVQVFANDTGGLSSTANGTFVVVCTPIFVNTSWSPWLNVSCLINDTMNQSRYLTQYDANYCEGIDNVTYYEYQIDGPCDYCTPNIINTSWTNWTTIECFIDDTANQSRYRTEYDINFCGEIGNVTYYEYRDTGYCNYCSEDLVGPFYNPEDCPDWAPYTQLQYYIDNNYDVCCAVTGLFSDCSIDYSPYLNSTVNCSPLVTTIEVDVDDIVYLDDRMYFMARINETNSTKCWSYVKKEGKILQTNPQKTEYSMSVLMRKKTEDREYFTPVKGRVNAYWTDQNIIPYDEFVLGIRCALDNGSIVTGEKHITHRYEDLRKVTARSVWGAKEMSMLVITIVFILFAISMVIWAWKK